MANFQFKTNLHEILICNLPCIKEDVIDDIENSILELRFNEWNNRCSNCFRNCNACQFRNTAITDKSDSNTSN